MKANLASCERLDNEDGMVPVNLLAVNAKSVRRVSFETDDGMLPVNLLKEKSKLTSCVRSENIDGMLPVKSL